MSNCKKLPYFEGLTDETIKQGSDFDLTEGVTAYDGNDEEIEYSTSPTNAEFNTCDVGSHVIQYHAGQPVDRFLPNICLGTDLAVSIPSYCDNYESVTKERIIRIIQASNPTIYGIPHVTIAQNEPFDPLNGVTAVDDNGNPITNIEYSGYLDKRVSGNPITITDGQSVVPVKSLKVTLEPIQDLNGYDKPWVGGAGKNLVPNKSPNVPVSYAGVTMTIDGNDFVFNGTSTGTGGRLVFMTESFPLKSGTYFISVSLSGSGDVYPVLHNANGNVVVKQGAGVVTIAEDINAFIGFNVSGTIGTAFDLKVKCQLESDSTASAWTPYSNICPISGRTEVVTQRTGKNLLDPDGFTEGLVSITIGDSIDAVTQTTRYVHSVAYDATNGLYFKFRSTDTTKVNWVAINMYGSDDKLADRTIVNLTGTGWQSYPIQANTHTKVIVQFGSPAGVVADTQYTEAIISIGSTTTAYEPYQGTTYTTDLGQTVYGGTLDVVSGELVVDRAMVTLDGSQNMQINGMTANTSRFFYTASPTKASGVDNFIADRFAYAPTDTVGSAVGRSGNGGIEFRLPTSVPQTVDGYKTWFTDNPTTLVYELATPQTYQLDPQTISLLHGDNNVWSDGQVVMVYSTEVPTEGDITYPLEGEYTLTYRATDKCGNVGEATRQITVVANEVQSVQNTESEVSE